MERALMTVDEIRDLPGRIVAPEELEAVCATAEAFWKVREMCARIAKRIGAEKTDSVEHEWCAERIAAAIRSPDFWKEPIP